ncbi:MAG: DUF1616 domain-containing protein [Thermoflexales bacterium]|nr:DUF1616 domain-containing protein [Thermoflexales bacterium]
MVRYTFVFVFLVSLLLVILTIPGRLLPVPLAAARLLLGLILALFCPGYALQAVLFPRRNGPDGFNRLALSVGISLALVPLLALALDQLPWGINLGFVVSAEVGVTLLALVTAWARWHRLPPESRWDWSLPSAVLARSLEGRPRFWVYVGMAGILAVGLWLLLAVVRLAGTGNPTTEFYLLGPDGWAGGYPRRAMVGRPLTVTVGVINGEETTVDYRLEVVDGDYLLGQTGPVRLNPGAAYEGPVSFTPARAGDAVRVQFLLYRNGLPVPYRTLWLWLRVEE